MAGLATGVPCVGLVDRRTCRHQYVVLMARECAVLGPGAVGDGGMHRLVICAAIVCCCALLWARRRRHPRPAHCPVFAAVGSLRPGCSGGGGNVFPSPPLSVFPWSALGRCDHSGGFVPPGQLCPSGGVGALWRLESLPTTWQDPCGFSATLEALLPPSSSPTMGDSWATPEALRPPSLPHTPEVLPLIFSRLPPFLPLCSGLAPWRPYAPAL